MVETIINNFGIWATAQTLKTSGRGISANNQKLYGVNKLRGLILELAVQGKLVSQDPNDEPASFLIKNIGITKTLPLISKDDTPFELPIGWIWCRLGDVGITNIGLTYSPNDLTDDGIPVLRSSNVQQGEISLTDLVRVKKDINEKALVKEGDLLICARNGSKSLVGKCAVIKELPEKMAFGAFMAIFRSEFNQYLKYFIESPIYRKSLEGVSTTTINQITQNNLKNTLLPLPPLPEQQRIVAKVDELMALCDQLEKEQANSNAAHEILVETMLETLTNAAGQAELESAWERIASHFDILFTTEHSVDRLKQTILQLAVMGKLVPQNPEEEPAGELVKRIEREKARLVKEGKIKKQKIMSRVAEEEKTFDLPNRWEWVRIGDLVEIKGGKRLPNGHSFSLTETPYIYIQVTNMKNGTILEDNLKYISSETKSQISQYLISKDDLYITIAGTIGDVGIVPDFFNGMNLTENAAKLVFTGINKNWLQKTLSSEVLQKQFKEKIKQLAQPKLALHRVESSCVALPPISEQQRIVAKVDELFGICDVLKERIREAQGIERDLAEAVVEGVV